MIKKPLRKRHRHEMQQKVSKGVIFANEEGENVSIGPRSMLEFFILESILKYCLQEGIKIIPENIAIIYNAIAEILDTTYTQLPIGSKTLSDIQSFLREHDHNLEIYRALCISLLSTQL